jgi:hypothetical protein
VSVTSTSTKDVRMIAITDKTQPSGMSDAHKRLAEHAARDLDELSGEVASRLFQRRDAFLEFGMLIRLQQLSRVIEASLAGDDEAVREAGAEAYGSFLSVMAAPSD